MDPLMNIYKPPFATVAVTSHCGREFTNHGAPATTDLLHHLASDVLERRQRHTQHCLECRVLSRLHTDPNQEELPL